MDDSIKQYFEQFYNNYIIDEDQSDHINGFNDIMKDKKSEYVKKFIDNLIDKMGYHNGKYSFYNDDNYSLEVDKKFYALIKHINRQKQFSEQQKKRIAHIHQTEGGLKDYILDFKTYDIDEEEDNERILYLLDDFIEHFVEDETYYLEWLQSIYNNFMRIGYLDKREDLEYIDSSKEVFSEMIDKIHKIIYKILLNKKEDIQNLNFSTFFIEVFMKKKLQNINYQRRSIVDEKILQLLLKEGIALKTLSSNNIYFKDEIDELYHKCEGLKILKEENLASLDKERAFIVIETILTNNTSGSTYAFSNPTIKIITDIFVISNLISTQDGKNIINNFDTNILNEIKRVLKMKILIEYNPLAKSIMETIDSTINNTDITYSVINLVYKNEYNLLNYIEKIQNSNNTYSQSRGGRKKNNKNM